MSSRKLQDQDKGGVVDQPGVHISIATSPKKGMDIREDLEMIKAALLYGNTATLYSLDSALAMHWLVELDQYPEGLRVRTLGDLIAGNPLTPKRERTLGNYIRYTQLVNLIIDQPHIRLREDDAHFLKVYGQIIELRWKAFTRSLQQAVLDEGGQGLLDAVEQKKLHIHSFASMQVNKEMPLVLQDVVNHMLMDATTYPLLDYGTAKRIGSSIKRDELSLTSGTARRSKEVSLASMLIKRLPQFPDASIDEILDIRSELEKYLIPFQNGIIEFSKEIEAVPWDEDFVGDADQLLRGKIAMAIEALEDEVKANKPLRQLVTKADKKEAAALISGVSGGMTLIMGQLDTLPQLIASVLTSVGVPALSGGAVGVALAAAKLWNERQQDQRKLETNRLWFYYQTKQRLSDNKRHRKKRR